MSNNDRIDASAEKTQKGSTEAVTARESASTLGVREAYEEMSRSVTSGGSDSTRTTDATDPNAATAIAGSDRSLTTGDKQKESPAKGLTSMELNADGSVTSKFNPEERRDRMSSQTFKRDGDVTATDSQFQGRADGMTFESTVAGPAGQRISQSFSDGRRVDTIISSNGEKTIAVSPKGDEQTGEKTIGVSDKGDEQTRESRERLNTAVEANITNPEQREQFKENMRRFEERAKKEGLPPEEVSKTYDAMNKLMTAPQTDSKLPSQEQRTVLAQQFMHHVVDGGQNIDQGDFNVCSTSVLAEKLMTQKPSAAGEVLASAATEGKFTAPDGKEIKLDAASMQPVTGSDTPAPVDGQRSHSTQVLNHALSNEISQRRVPPEFIKQLNGVDETGKNLAPQDTGERRTGGSFDGPLARTKDGAVDRSPNINPKELESSIERFTNQKESVLLNSLDFNVDGGNSFATPKQLLERVREAERTGRLPLAIMVDAKHPAISGVNDNAPDRIDGHVVSIRGVDESTGGLKISNQWGSQYDGVISAEKLFDASRVAGKLELAPKPEAAKFNPLAFSDNSAMATSSSTRSHSRTHSSRDQSVFKARARGR